MAITPDNKFVFAGWCNRPVISVWNLETGAFYGTIQLDNFFLNNRAGELGTVNSLTVSPDNKLLYVGCSNTNGILVWDIQNHRPLITLVTPTVTTGNSQVTSLAISPNNQFLVAIINCNILAIVDLQAQQIVGKFVLGEAFNATAVPISEDNNFIFIGGTFFCSAMLQDQCFLDVFDARPIKLLSKLVVPVDRSVKRCAISSNLKYIVSKYVDHFGGTFGIVKLANYRDILSCLH